MNRSEVKSLLIKKQMEITRSISLLNDLKLKRYYLITLDMDHDKEYLNLFGHTKVLIKPFDFLINNLKVTVLASEANLSRNADYYYYKEQAMTLIRYGAIIDYEAWDTSTAPLLLGYEYLSDLFKENIANNNWS